MLVIAIGLRLFVTAQPKAIGLIDGTQSLTKYCLYSECPMVSILSFAFEYDLARCEGRNPTWELHSDADFSQLPAVRDKGFLSYPSERASSVQLSCIQSSMIRTCDSGMDVVSGSLKRPSTVFLAILLLSNSLYFTRGLLIKTEHYSLLEVCQPLKYP